MTTQPLADLLTTAYRELKALSASLGERDEALSHALLALEQPAIPGPAATLDVPFEPASRPANGHSESRVIVSDNLRTLQAVALILAEAKRPDLAEQVIADIETLRNVMDAEIQQQP